MKQTLGNQGESGRILGNPGVLSVFPGVRETWSKSGSLPGNPGDLRALQFSYHVISRFLTISVMVNIKYSDVCFEHGFVKLFIERHVTDIYHGGHWD